MNFQFRFMHPYGASAVCARNLVDLLVDLLLQLLPHPLPYRFMLIPDKYPLLAFGTVLYLLTVPAGAGVGIPP